MDVCIAFGGRRAITKEGKRGGEIKWGIMSAKQGGGESKGTCTLCESTPKNAEIGIMMGGRERIPIGEREKKTIKARDEGAGQLLASEHLLVIEKAKGIRTSVGKEQRTCECETGKIEARNTWGGVPRGVGRACFSQKKPERKKRSRPASTIAWLHWRGCAGDRETQSKKSISRKE